MQTWDLWYPNAAAQGLSFCRARIEDTERTWIHSPPDALRVEVRDDAGGLLAWADQLKCSSAKTLPMARLTIVDGSVVREDGWPSDTDIGSVVLLPGGEAGILKSWWNAADEREWRWTVEFYNRV